MDVTITAQEHTSTTLGNETCVYESQSIELKCCDTDNLVIDDDIEIAPNYLRALHRTLSGRIRQDNFRNSKIYTFKYSKMNKALFSKLEGIIDRQAANGQCITVSIKDPCDQSACACNSTEISGVLTLGSFTNPPGCEYEDVSFTLEESNDSECEICAQ